ncbi:hypothetical protein GCM10009555_017800 [Acrocarpospora macrocephala]|uniref:Uncharacterized protein n=1 Tax=Acrocarpospora macrocephala TaxID=150177 RepID=A0A5M3WGM4_9ACTN|nr:hypothetical protein [Acrocarpospora macrocephala]GES07440.1 hypothetical protein Amac_010350 [Acrocarpospora macrocephala]
MPTRRTVEVEADATDPKRGMTLDEMAAFVQEAMRAEVPGDTPVKIRVNWSSGIKRLEIKG